MNQSEREKQALEHQATVLFLQHYKALFSVTAGKISHNQPAKPDVSVSINDKQVDIEVAHLYASETEAMAVLGRPLSLPLQHELAELAQEPTERQLCHALQCLLAKKATKRYQSSGPWLLIRSASSLWTHDDFVRALTSLTIPQKHPFSRIWLLTDWFAKQEPIALYPDTHVFTSNKEERIRSKKFY